MTSTPIDAVGPTHAEIEHLRHELFRDDVYRATRTFNGTQLWFDAGCHIGLFTNLAEAYGANVIGGLDADPIMVDAYRDRCIQPAVMHRVTTAEGIIGALNTFGPVAAHVNALKLDVQGAEVPILTSVRHATILAIQFHTLLFEYHDPESLLTMLLVLETVGYEIDFIDAAVDGLTHRPTHIVHAHR